MRLNKYHKDAFVEAVLQDLPTVDYDEIAQKLVREAVIEKMPAKVRAVYDDKDVRHWLQKEWIGMPGSLQNFYCVSDSTSGNTPDALKGRLDELNAAKREQVRTQEAFRQKIRAAIDSCQTRKQALELMPEFEKYLPKDTTKTGISNFPVINNLVAELVQAGWPKDAEQPAG